MKKFLALFLAVLMVVLSAPVVFAVEEDERKIVDSYSCGECSFNWTLYDDYSLLLEGDCAASNHGHGEEFKRAQKATKVILSDDFRIFELYFQEFNKLYLCEEYVVSENNPYYSVIDGVLFNKNKTALLNYPQGKKNAEYEIPGTVKELCWYAFSTYEESVEDNISYLETLIVPSNVEYITSYSCMYSSLEKVIFEDGDRTLIIGDAAFYSSDNLSSITLPSSRVYSLVATSFADTAFYNNEDNWENGVLYLEDIILDVDQEKMGSEYTIKDGTKTIADLAAFAYVPENATYDAMLISKVIIPDSLDNIGAATIFDYEEAPENVFRIGTNYYKISPTSISDIYVYAYKDVIENIENLYIKWEENALKWQEKWIVDGEVPVEAWADFPEECLYTTYTENSWIHYKESQIAGSNVVDEITFIEEGTKGIADETLHYSWFPSAAVGFHSDGLILPESFETLSGRTILDGKQYSTLLNYTHSEVTPEPREMSVTFLNRDTEFFDNANTLAEVYTICGYKGSTAHEYAIKYNRKFVDIEQCAHEETAVKLGVKATCKTEGLTGDIYCQYCGTLLKEGGEIIPKSDHNFNHWYIKSETTCTTDGTEYSNCSVCSFEETRVYEKAPGHKLHTVITEHPDCYNFGEEYTYCENCDYESWVSLQKLEHEDNNHDGKCDNCGEDLTADCSCNCHKTGIMSIIYKIMRFFWKLFGMKKVCECGVSHY